MKKAQGPGVLPGRSDPPPAAPASRPADGARVRRPARRPTPKLRLVIPRRTAAAAAAVLAAVLLAGVLPAALGAYARPAGTTPTASPKATRVPGTATPSAPTASPTVSPRPPQPTLAPQVSIAAGGYRVWPKDYAYAPGYVVDPAELASRATGTLPLEGIVVVLDPGHGGQDGGAVYPVSNKAEIVEKTVALDVALRARDALVALGAEVVMTRADDSWVSLYKRIGLTHQAVLARHAAYLEAMGSRAWPDATETRRLSALVQPCIDVNSDYLNGKGLGVFKNYGVIPEVRTMFDIDRQHADIVFVALHCNANDSPKAQGLSVLYLDTKKVYRTERSTGGNPTYSFYDDENRVRFGQALYDGIAASEPRLVSDGFVQPLIDQNLAVLREMNLVGVLVEMGFVSNASDRAVLLSDAGQANIAKGVAAGVVAYFRGG